jgi:CheY-like chemotaxis protein
LVEDEAVIRMMIVEMLEELGHRVIAEAGNIRTAEPLAQTAAFDLGVLDINVAGFNISPVAEIVAARGLPFIFVSGYGPEGRPVMFTDKPVLRKPGVPSLAQSWCSSFTACLQVGNGMRKTNFTRTAVGEAKLSGSKNGCWFSR